MPPADATPPAGAVDLDALAALERAAGKDGG
jgi:hypothetical protein